MRSLAVASWWPGHLLLVATAAAQAPPAVTRDLSGTVEGAAGARVRVTVWHNDMQRCLLEPVGECLAAADGTFALRAVPWFARQQWGWHAMVVSARTERRAALLPLRGDDAATAGLRLTLADTVDITGSVCVRDTGKPIVGACLWPATFGDAKGLPRVWLTEPMLPWHAVTDAEGRFTLQGVPDMPPWKLMAVHDDFGREWIDVADPSKPVRAELSPGGRISGTVLMPDGKPAVRVPVQTSGRGAGYGRTTTDEGGRFTLTGLAPDVYKVWAEAPDLTVIAAADLEVRPGSHLQGQVVQFVRGGFIAGRIFDAATGAPFVPGSWTDVAMYGPARPGGGACECTPVLPDGTFRIRAPAGANRIYLRGAAGWEQPSEVVTVVEGEETKVEWRLQRGPRR